MYGTREHHAPGRKPDWSFLHHSFQPLTRRTNLNAPTGYTVAAVRHMQRKAYRRGMLVGFGITASIVLAAAVVSFAIAYWRYS